MRDLGLVLIAVTDAVQPWIATILGGVMSQTYISGHRPILETDAAQPTRMDQQPLGRSIALHLLPGLPLLAFPMLVTPILQARGFPAVFAMSLGILLVLVPLELGGLLYLGRKRNGCLSLEGIVGYREWMPLWQYALYTLIAIVWYFSAISAWARLQPTLADALAWLPARALDPLPLNDTGSYASTVLLAAAALRLVCSGIVAPVVEELYFRGYLLPRIEQLGRWAPVLNVTLFSFHHFWTPLLNPGRVIALLPLVYLVWRKRNIYLGILVHLILNLVSVIVPVTAMLASPVSSQAMPTTEARTIQGDFAAIDRYVEAEMAATRLPGVALAIVQGDEIVHLKGFGQADPSGRGVTPQIPFTIGSTTKSFTALAIMQLVEAGKVELEAPVQRYLPWFRVANADASARITVRHLLTMTSGVPTIDGTVEVTSDDLSDDALEQRVRQMSELSLTQPVGATWQYSNANYNTLGLIVQTVSGQSYESYVREHIVAPLDMRNAYTSPKEAQAYGRATGYRYWFGWPMPYEMPYDRGTLPAGFLTASVEDMAHYLIAHLNGGRYSDRSILSPGGIALLHQPAIAIGHQDWQYGMGWFVSSINSVPTISHGGDLPNFHADIVLVPEGQWGVVLLMNGENGLSNERIAHIASGVTALLIGTEPPPVMQSTARLTLLMFALLVAAVQLLEITRTTVLVRHWRRQPSRRPHGLLRIGWHIVPPLVFNAAWVWLALTGLRLLVGTSLRASLVHVPDLGYTLLLTVAIALVWSLLRIGIIYQALRQKPLSRGIDVSVPL
jgi:CubicO group peptidase (beta-lactamase class C family)/membrane protease YdiL (CAAX protease family)